MRLRSSVAFDLGPIPPDDPGCRCRHEPELRAAGRELAVQSARLRRDPAGVAPVSKHHITFSVVGGFNNQRQCLINAVVAFTGLPNSVMVLPAATPIAYPRMERWPHDYVNPYDNRSQWLPFGYHGYRSGRFETLWDPEQWLRAMRSTGLRVAVGSPHARARDLPDAVEVTGCRIQDFDKNADCLRYNRSNWEPLRRTVQRWAAVLRSSPPQRWIASPLCFQVAPLEASDHNCAALFGSRICEVAFSALRPNRLAVAAARLVLRGLAGVRWAAVHLQEDWDCPELSTHLLRALHRNGIRNGSAVMLTGFAEVPESVGAALRRRGVRVLTKDRGLPSARERLPYEIAGQVDWLLACSAPGPFFYHNYSLMSSFDIYAAQERRRRNLSSVLVHPGAGCEHGMKDWFNEVQLKGKVPRRRKVQRPRR